MLRIKIGFIFLFAFMLYAFDASAMCCTTCEIPGQGEGCCMDPATPCSFGENRRCTSLMYNLCVPRPSCGGVPVCVEGTPGCFAGAPCGSGGTYQCGTTTGSPSLMSPDPPVYCGCVGCGATPTCAPPTPGSCPDGSTPTQGPAPACAETCPPPTGCVADGDICGANNYQFDPTNKCDGLYGPSTTVASCATQCCSGAANFAEIVMCTPLEMTPPQATARLIRCASAPTCTPPTPGSCSDGSTPTQGPAPACAETCPTPPGCQPEVLTISITELPWTIPAQAGSTCPTATGATSAFNITEVPVSGLPSGFSFVAPNSPNEIPTALTYTRQVPSAAVCPPPIPATCSDGSTPALTVGHPTCTYAACPPTTCTPPTPGSCADGSTPTQSAFPACTETCPPVFPPSCMADGDVCKLAGMCGGGPEALDNCGAGTACCSMTTHNVSVPGCFSDEIRCGPAPSASCANPFGGADIPHGGTITAYQTASVPCGGTCNSEVRTCSNGILSGSYTNPACTVGSCGCGGLTCASGEPGCFSMGSCGSGGHWVCTVPDGSGNFSCSCTGCSTYLACGSASLPAFPPDCVCLNNAFMSLTEACEDFYGSPYPPGCRMVYRNCGPCVAPQTPACIGVMPYGY